MFVPGESSARSAATHTGKECSKMTKNVGLGAQQEPGFKAQSQQLWARAPGTAETVRMFATPTPLPRQNL